MKMTYRKAAFIGLWAGVIFASCSSDEDMITGKRCRKVNIRLP